jgi:hypothetical protein
VKGSGGFCQEKRTLGYEFSETLAKNKYAKVETHGGRMVKAFPWQANSKVSLQDMVGP